jgi:hypothetical protein
MCLNTLHKGDSGDDDNNKLQLGCHPVAVVILHVISRVISFISVRAGIAQSVWRPATGWMVRGLNPGEGEIFLTSPYRPWGPPGLLYGGYRVFLGG